VHICAWFCRVRFACLGGSASLRDRYKQHLSVRARLLAARARLVVRIAGDSINQTSSGAYQARHQ